MKKYKNKKKYKMLKKMRFFHFCKKHEKFGKNFSCKNLL